jgi:NADPH:quinone reductase
MSERLTVKEWIVRRLGRPDSMTFEEVSLGPVPPGMLRVAVEASALNFFDGLIVAGSYQARPELPFVPGGEVAGRVMAAPPDSGFAVGDRVMARRAPGGVEGGGYAEVAHVEPRSTVKMPDAMPFDDAAAFMVNFQTGWFGLHRRAGLEQGEVLLVHAGAGGVGSAAIQLGKAAGAVVIATAGSPEKVEICRRLGADSVIDYKAKDFVEAVKDMTNGRGANVIYDPVGGEVFDRSTKCIAFEGRLVTVGFASGRIPTLAVNHALIKNYSLVGLHWGLYPERRPDLVDLCTEALLGLYRDSRIRPFISRRLPLAEAAAGLEDVMAGRSAGKTVLLTDRLS